MGATAIAYGQTLTGNLSVVGSSQALTFAGTSGESILLRLVEQASDWNPQVRIYGPGGALLTGTWGYSLVDLNAIVLTATGTHTIVVNDLGGTGTGGYAVHLQRLSGPAGATGIAYGQTQSGTVTQAVETRAYTFSGTVGDVVLGRVMELASGFYPQVRLYGPTGQQLATATGATLAELPATTLTATGTHTLLVLGNGGTETGGFNLHVQRLNGPVGATAIAYGQTLTGNLVQVGQAEAFTFAGAPGDSVQVVMTELAADLLPQLRMYGPDGALVAGTWSYTSAALTVADLPSAGTFTLLCTDLSGAQTGQYTLRMSGAVTAVPETPVRAFVLHPNHPNPFNPMTTIAFDLASPAAARLVIYDVRGGVVRTLLDEPRAGGRHTVVWDGRDQGGREVASGTYLYVLSAGTERARGRMMLVR